MITDAGRIALVFLIASMIVVPICLGSYFEHTEKMARIERLCEVAK